jgi:hypothetical protein
MLSNTSTGGIVSVDYQALLYFIFIWLVSALAGAFRCVRNGDYKSVSNTVSIAGVSGFLGFGVVSIFIGDIYSAGFNGPYWLGIASIIGLAGKEQTALITIMWNHLIDKFVPKEIK